METSTGIVVRCSHAYYIVWGKDHGYVFVPIVPDLKAEPGEWVEYCCIEDETPLEGIHYTAIFCINTVSVAECRRNENGSLLCNAELVTFKSPLEGAVVPRGHFAMESDTLGVIFVPSHLATSVADGGNKIECMVSLDVTSKERYPWTVDQVKRDGSYYKVRDVPSTSFSPQRAEPPVSQGTVQKQDFNEIKTNVELSPSTVEVIQDTGGSGSTASFPVERYLPDLASNKKKVPAAILFKVDRNYGLIWNYNIGVVVVRQDHLNQIPMGTWVSTRAARVLNRDATLDFDYVATVPLTKIDELLELRTNGTIVEVRVTMEPGDFEYIEKFGARYLERRSELGPVYVPVERVDDRFRTQRFKAWVTLMNYRLWTAQCDEDFVHVDHNGKPVVEESAASPEPTFYDAAEFCESNAKRDLLEKATARFEVSEGQERSSSVVDEASELEDKSSVEQPFMSTVQNVAARVSERFAGMACEDRILERRQSSVSPSCTGSRSTTNKMSEEAPQETLKVSAAEATELPKLAPPVHEMSLFQALNIVLSNEEVKQAIVSGGLEAELNYVLENITF